MFISTKALRNLFWLGTAGTFFLFGITHWRPEIAVFPVPVPMMFIGILFSFGILAPLLLWGKVRVNFSTKKYKILWLLCGLFFLWHLFTLVPSEAKALGMKEAVKLGIGQAAFWSVLALFPRDQKFLERFWRLVLWFTVPLLAYLIYMHIFVWHIDFLTTDLTGGGSKFGRNQLSW